MAKYSTGGNTPDEGGSCELCGAEDRDLRTEQVAGAMLAVCADCGARHAEGGHDRDAYGQQTGTRDSDEEDRKKQAARNTARMTDTQQDSTHWEKGADYERDPLPYLVRGYGDRVATARAAADLSVAELADELAVPESDVHAVEEDRATSAGIGGSLIEALEDHLDVTLSDES